MFVVLSEETEGDQGHGVVGPGVVQDFKQIDTFLKTVHGGLLAVFCFGTSVLDQEVFKRPCLFKREVYRSSETIGKCSNIRPEWAP